MISTEKHLLYQSFNFKNIVYASVCLSQSHGNICNSSKPHKFKIVERNVNKPMFLHVSSTAF